MTEHNWTDWEPEPGVLDGWNSECERCGLLKFRWRIRKGKDQYRYDHLKWSTKEPGCNEWMMRSALK